MTTPTLCELDPATEPAERHVNPQELWKHYAKQGHGSPTENELIRQYLPLVKTVVGRLAMTLPAHVDPDDLHSAGLVGLLNAVRRFDPKSGASFETYARLRIRGAVFDELRRLDWVPRSIHDKARRVEEVVRRLEQEKGRVPSEPEIAQALHLSLDDYRHLVEQIRPASFVCLDAARGHDNEDGAPQYEAVVDASQTDPGQGVMRRELARLIADRLEQLPEMQRKVLALYYFEDLRLREIAEVFGVTESRICQIHTQAIMAIRSFLHKHDATPA